MPRDYTSIACLWLLLTCVAAAQDSKPGPYTGPPPGTVLPAVPIVPGPPTLVPSIPNIVQPDFPPRLAPMIPPSPGRGGQPLTREAYTGPVKIALDDGTTLSGEIQAVGPLDCVASFGPIAVPFNKLRGILWRESSDSHTPQDRQATLVLDNSDTLTVTVSCPGVPVKTTWGQANVELPHVRSMLLTTDKVRWAETPDGRRILAPESDSSSAAPPQ